MSYNNFYHNLRGKSTFQSNMRSAMPPPPLPQQYYLSLAQPPKLLDENIMKQFESRLPNSLPKASNKIVSISEVHSQISNLALFLNEIKTEQKMLSEKINDLSDDEWNRHLQIIEDNKHKISSILSNINNLNTEVLRKLLAKRASKRARQKRQRIEKKKEKEELKKQNEEKSRKIDEYLQKFQDDMNRAKQEEEAKLQADAVLKETIRKKQDAKKYLVKLDALVKLRKARFNTAKGRGENVSDKEAEVFEANIGKLKTMWLNRLAVYENEESVLRAKLKIKQDSEQTDIKRNEIEREVNENLEQWKEVLFGGVMPQVDLAGDISRFVEVRSQWDQYLNMEGTSMPIGWVPPTAQTMELT